MFQWRQGVVRNRMRQGVSHLLSLEIFVGISRDTVVMGEIKAVKVAKIALFLK